MPQIFLSQSSCSIAQLVGHDREAIEGFCEINAMPYNGLLIPARPYALAPLDRQGRDILNTITAVPLRERRQLAACVDRFGQETRLLAAFYAKHIEPQVQNTPTIVGAGAVAAQTRLDGFGGVLQRYQAALLELHSFERAPGNTRGGGAQRVRLQESVRRAHEALNREYRVELQRLVSRHELGRNRGTALSGADRGITLAKRTKGRGLYVADLAEARWLGTLSRSVRWVGNNIVALDFGMRAKGVSDTFSAGGDWMRQASVQATGFGLGGAAGTILGKATVGGGATAIAAIGLTLTPVGWVALLGAGIAMGAGAGHAGDMFGQYLAGRIWDRGR